MTKADLVEEVTQLGDLTRRDGEMIVDTIFDSVIHALRSGDKIEIRQKSREVKEIVASLAQVDKRPVLSWLELDKGNFIGTFKGAPVREEMNEPAIREQYVVEYYSR